MKAKNKKNPCNRCVQQHLFFLKSMLLFDDMQKWARATDRRRATGTQTSKKKTVTKKLKHY